MKKIFLVLFISIAITCGAFSQRIGVSVDYEAALGDINTFVSSNIGGGIAAEYDIPLNLPETVRFGISTKIGAGANLVKDDLLSGMWNIKIVPGVYFRFLLLDRAFILQPELGYGTQLNFPTANPVYNNDLNAIYIDQVIMFSLGVRYCPKQLLDGRMEFALTPTYYICPENDTLVHYLGATLGIFFKL